jgi:hypothetical protein
LAINPDLRHELGAGAFTKALSHLAPSVEAENWRKVYHKVLIGATHPEVAMAEV